MPKAGLNSIIFYTCVFCAVIWLASCTVPKHYQKGKPFVFKNTISLEGNFSRDEKRNLITKLEQQIDDSLKVRIKSYVGIYREIVAPPAFDTISMSRSITYMDALLKSMGYFRSSITDSFYLDTVNSNQIRAFTYFKVAPDKVLRIDSIGYSIRDTALQRLASRRQDRSQLAKGDPFTKSSISAELDRMIESFRNNGFYKITADELYAEADTVDIALISMDADPFDQLGIIAAMQKRRDNPTVDVVFKQRPVTDSTKLMKYYIRNVNIYPDLELLDSTHTYTYDVYKFNGHTVYSRKNLFKPSFLVKNLRLDSGKLYRQVNYFRTINTLNQLGAWSQVSVEIKEIYDDTIPQLDFDIRMIPAKKQALILELEGSRNTGNDVFASGNLLGIGLNIGLRNRNVFREAIQSSSVLRGSIELNPGKGDDFILSRQLNFSHSYSIPRLLIPFRVDESRLKGLRTLISLNAGYTYRKDQFNLGTVNTSIGYEWARRNNVFLLRALNVELNKLDGKAQFDSILNKNPLLRYTYNEGLIIGSGFSFVNSSRNNLNHLRYMRFAVEESGAITGSIFRGLVNDLYRFVKLDAEYKYYIERPKHVLAFRVMGGYGLAYGKNEDKNKRLPFFRQYFAGGPNSMRAWQLRTLGPGSFGPADTVGKGNLIDFQLADIQLEGNFEYRFNLGTIAGVKIKSALFTDIGNIWFRNRLNPDVEEEFNIGRLYKDLAIAGGTSLRFDFDYFLIRFDWAYKLKDPFYSHISNGWFQNMKLTNGQLQLGIGYPF